MVIRIEFNWVIVNIRCCFTSIDMAFGTGAAVDITMIVDIRMVVDIRPLVDDCKMQNDVT